MVPEFLPVDTLLYGVKKSYCTLSDGDTLLRAALSETVDRVHIILPGGSVEWVFHLLARIMRDRKTKARSCLSEIHPGSALFLRVHSEDRFRLPFGTTRGFCGERLHRVPLFKEGDEIEIHSLVLICTGPGYPDPGRWIIRSH